ncbi:MAG: methionyl-tRNA formyltransferase [Thiomicrorhabdus sp.]|nr:MAG: methionyl-tRNA formyltransferase [Thiomicrorhabdus sp.]
MKYLDLTVLFVDSVPSRVYLAMLKKQGLIPNKIIYIDIEPTSRKFDLLKSIMGGFLAKKAYKLYRCLNRRKTYTLGQKLLSEFELTYNDLNFDIFRYPAHEVEKVVVTGLEDLVFFEKILNENNKTFLFTGGGILKKNLLSIPKSKFIHIHPGLVPDIKGADCFLWSCLMKKKPGFSVFYMNPGIDTGDIIYSREYAFQYSEDKYGEYSNNDIYRTLLDFYDPALRILTLIELIKNSGKLNENIEFDQFESTQQNPTDGRTYFFMHKSLRNYVIDNLKVK